MINSDRLFSVPAPVTQKQLKMKSGPTDHDKLEQMLEERAQQIEVLQKSLTEAENKAQKYEQEWSALYDRNKELLGEKHQLFQDYETLRLQKGGFGFKAMMISGCTGFLVALVLCFVYLKLKPKNPHVVAFRQFEREHLFNYELAISQGRFHDVERSMQQNMDRPEYRPIANEIEFAKNLVAAARNRCN